MKSETKEKIDSILNDWKTYVILVLALLILLGRPYIGNLINRDPLYCDRYGDLWLLKDEYEVSCKLTCARDHGCDIAWSDNTYFNYTTYLCHCGNETIDYYCYIRNYTVIDPFVQDPCTFAPSVVTWGN